MCAGLQVILRCPVYQRRTMKASTRSGEYSDMLNQQRKSPSVATTHASAVLSITRRSAGWQCYIKLQHCAHRDSVLGLDVRAIVYSAILKMVDFVCMHTNESLQATNGTPKRHIACSECQRRRCKVSFIHHLSH